MDNQQPVTILRDTGAAQSFLLSTVMPLSVDTYCGADRVVQDIGLRYVNVPLHSVYLQSDLVCGKVEVGVCTKLPISGVTFILGNDLAGGKVLPVPEVLSEPVISEVQSFPKDDQTSLVFPACVVTHAQARKMLQICLIHFCVLMFYLAVSYP